MEPLLHSTMLLSAPAVSALISAVWEGAVLAGCVALCLRLLPRLSAASRSLIWMNVFLLLALLQFVPAFSGHDSTGGPLSVSSLHSFGLLHPFHLDLRFSYGLAALWALLSLWRGTQLIVGAIHLRRLANRATLIDTNAALEALLRDRHEGGRAAELCTSIEVERPSVFGFFRPRILVPPGLIEKLSPAEVRQVVLHEMEHLRRADDWTNLLQKIGLVLFPLNPVLLWVERRLCRERELACDDRVLRSGGARKAYALCLTRLAEYSILRRSLTLALCAWERQSELVRRVHRVLRRPHEAMGVRQARLVSGGLIVGVLGGAIALARSPQLVSFVAPAPSALEAQNMPLAVFREVNLRQPELRHSAIRRPEGSPHMVNVNAVLSQRPATSLSAPNRARRRLATRNVKQHDAQNRPEWVVLTRWQVNEIPPGAVIAVDLETHTSYAAVPIMNGWLIVQI
jgi:beta-lactamase regulating signal transducer with metallopeptidase domain